MDTLEKHFLCALRESCEEIRLDYFPQVEASELLYRVITLEDIYLPLNLKLFDGASNRGSDDFDIEDLIRRIDAKIAELEKAEAEEKARQTGVPVLEPENGTSLGISLEPQSNNSVAVKTEIVKEASQAGMRLLLKAGPGAGKTTFCKRLTLAHLNHDQTFFAKYFEENGLIFNQDRFVLLLNCKNITDLSVEDIQEKDFPSLVYRLCQLGLGSGFSCVSEEPFLKMLQRKAESGLFLILDGWDEILDAEKERAFIQKIDAFLARYSYTDLMVTIRPTYGEPDLEQEFLLKYEIKELSTEDVRVFCRKWCDVILSTTSQKKNAHEQIAEQIINSSDIQISNMRKNPLDLSLLLTVSKNDGRLPDNKADLFKEVVDLYIYWSTHKNTGVLSAKSIRIFLAYIAASLTKKKKMSCSHEELKQIVTQCITDLEWTFSEDLSHVDVASIIKELSRTGLLICTGNGNSFTFSESRRQSHRQVQEYLTAYAIQVQYADEEYNNMSPVEIFEDKYGIQLWREVILFIALMNNGRLRHELVKRLIEKAKNTTEDNYNYTNLLFALIVNGADIRLVDKHAIYDILFEEHITDQQIAYIISLVTSHNRISVEFIDYINEKFVCSVAEGDSKYGYAKAIIEASLALKQGVSPLNHATRLLVCAENESAVKTASLIILLMAWCKYSNINNAFKPYYSRYKMDTDVILAITNLLGRDVCKIDLLKCIKEAILADFTTFGDFFCIANLDGCFNSLELQQDSEGAEIIISMVPVFSSDFSPCEFLSYDVREKYLKRFKDEYERKAYDELIFTFTICVATNCWKSEEMDDVWKLVEKLYSKSKDVTDMGKTQFKRLKAQKDSVQLKKLLEEKEKWLEETENIPDAFGFSNYELQEPSPNFWQLTDRLDNQFVYQCGAKKMVVYHNGYPLSNDASDFLDSVIIESIPSNNNLAYLLRRGEISRVEMIVAGLNHGILPEELLEDGVKAQEPFSLLNMALARSKTYINTIGDPEKGRIALLMSSSLDEQNDKWGAAIRWWLDLACKRHEFEGLVVMHWLLDLKIFTPEKYDSYTIETLIALAQKLPKDQITGIQEFIATLEHILLRQEQ